MKKVLVILSLMTFAFTAKAQFGISAGVSGLKFTGDVGKENNTNYFGDARMGYHFGVDYRVGKILGIGLTGIYGTLQGTDNSANSHRNFQSKIMGGQLDVIAFFDKVKDSIGMASPFISIGIGYTTFNPMGDLKDANGATYNHLQLLGRRFDPRSDGIKGQRSLCADPDPRLQLRDPVKGFGSELQSQLPVPSYQPGIKIPDGIPHQYPRGPQLQHGLQ
jgi:hypothetical protein